MSHWPQVTLALLPPLGPLETCEAEGLGQAQMGSSEAHWSGDFVLQRGRRQPKKTALDPEEPGISSGKNKDFASNTGDFARNWVLEPSKITSTKEWESNQCFNTIQHMYDLIYIDDFYIHVYFAFGCFGLISI